MDVIISSFLPSISPWITNIRRAAVTHVTSSSCLCPACSCFVHVPNGVCWHKAEMKVLFIARKSEWWCKLGIHSVWCMCSDSNSQLCGLKKLCHWIWMVRIIIMNYFCSILFLISSDCHDEMLLIQIALKIKSLLAVNQGGSKTFAKLLFVAASFCRWSTY